MFRAFLRKNIFIEHLKKQGFKNITGIEIDKDLIEKNSNIINTSFIKCDFKNQFDIVIGNPPYIRWKNLESDLKKELATDKLWQNYCNSLCDYSSIFILKSIEALKEQGELVFITSDYWFTTTHAKKIRNYILENGYIESIYHFNETPIFEKVNASFVIFKFIKDTTKKPNIHIFQYSSRKKLDKDILISIKNNSNQNINKFDIPQFIKNEKWILAPMSNISEINKYEKACNNQIFGEYCDIGNGMVSGLDKAFQLPPNVTLNKIENDNVIEVIKAKHLETHNYTSSVKYIFLNNINNESVLKNEYENFYNQLINYKNKLLKRYNYNKDLKYWDWAFLRNFNLFSSSKRRIFCPCKERVTNKNRFRFCIVPSNYYPTQDVTALLLKENVEESIEYITALLNSKYVFQWLSNKGIRKGGIVEFSEKPISSIPYRKIDFSNPKERKIHDDIVKAVQEYSIDKNKEKFNLIDSYIGQLIE